MAKKKEKKCPICKEAFTAFENTITYMNTMKLCFVFPSGKKAHIDCIANKLEKLLNL